MANRHIRVLAIPACASLLLAACTGISDKTYAYKLYPGPPRASSEIAIVQLSDTSEYTFNGRPVSRHDWTEVHLLPGEHVVQWVMTAYSPPTYIKNYLVLEASHVYSMRMSIVGWSERVPYCWVVDNSTGEIVAGTPEP